MPTSKKQMVKLNQAKKAKAEDLSKQAAAGSQEAKKSSKSSKKSASEQPCSFFLISLPKKSFYLIFVA